MSSTNPFPTVVCAINELYALPLAVMLRSLLGSLRHDENISVVILHSAVSEKAQCKVISSLGRQTPINLQWRRVGDDNLRGLKVSHHVSTETYIRLLIADTLPELSKVIYLDADLIVRRSILDLWKIPMDGHILLAARDFSEFSGIASSPKGIKNYQAIGMPEDATIFNAGVMCIDLDAWRSRNVTSDILHYLNFYAKDINLWDQDGLNAILWNEWKEIDYRWNVTASAVRDYEKTVKPPYSNQEFKIMIDDPFIYHYTSSEKPWHARYKLPYSEYFLYWRKNIIW